MKQNEKLDVFIFERRINREASFAKLKRGERIRQEISARSLNERVDEQIKEFLHGECGISEGTAISACSTQSSVII